jgi:hypothetical protein
MGGRLPRHHGGRSTSSSMGWQTARQSSRGRAESADSEPSATFATLLNGARQRCNRWNRPKTKPGTETETLSAAARIRAAKRVDGRSSRVATYAHCSALLCEVHARQSPVHVAAAMVHRRASSVALIVHCSRRRWTSCDPSLQPGCNQCMCLVHVVCCVSPVCRLCAALRSRSRRKSSGPPIRPPSCTTAVHLRAPHNLGGMKGACVCIASYL